jgi:hypothetical protein
MNRGFSVKSTIKIAAVLGVMVSQFVPAPAALAKTFGDGPLDAVKTQASQYLCGNLTTNKLAAMMMAPTWEETGASGAPSPMAMGRSDTYSLSSANINLYSNATIGGAERDFFHAGIGLWQLDDAGIGKNMPAFQRITSGTAGDKAAQQMAGTYCAAGGTDANKRAAAWGPWVACNDGSCESVFQTIYCGSTNSICNISTTAVTKDGGMATHLCREQSSSATFTCYYVDIQAAQGDVSYWRETAPKSGNSSGGWPSPVTQSFYNWDSSANVENRDWLEVDTGYPNEWRAKRDEGYSSRSSTHMTWNNPSFSNQLCDVSSGRGHCTPPNL